MTYLGPVATLEYIQVKIFTYMSFFETANAIFLQKIVSCAWFSKKISLRMGDSHCAREVQLVLRLDSLHDDFNAHSFGHLDQSAHNPFTALSCQD